MLILTTRAQVDFLEMFQRNIGEKGTRLRRETKGYGGTPWQTVAQALAHWQEAPPFAAKATSTRPGAPSNLSGTTHTQATQPRTLPYAHIRPSSSLEKPDFSALPISPEYEK